MSDERMSDAEFDVLVARSICNPAIWTEARRARAREVELTARVEELHRLLERAEGLADDVADDDDEYDGAPLMVRERARALSEDIRAALTPPTPKETE